MTNIPPTPLMQAQAVGYRIDGQAILHPLDLTLSQGELLGLVGPNGSGKSTLLKLFAGLIDPCDGQLLFQGVRYGDDNRLQRARKIAYIPQKVHAHWPIRVEQSVALGRLPHFDSQPVSNLEERRIIESVMEETDILHLRKRAIDTLSGGELARSTIARALATQPQIILADEPTAALDPSHQLAVMALLQSRAKRGTSMIISLHDLTLAAHYCDRIVLLNRGHTVAKGLPKSVLNPKNLADVYKIRPANPLLPHEASLKHPWERL